AQDVQQRIENLPEVETAGVEVVFDPPWSQNMMSEAARLELGLF
ncbi:MAG: putative Fe-S cluster assembly protein SufT, partial [Thermoanaerobaculia bacterium]